MHVFLILMSSVSTYPLQYPHLYAIELILLLAFTAQHSIPYNIASFIVVQ